ncbi:MAG: hypothetical protein GWP10_20835, partial [Nitrospiraceae bacterium]|nr:hypothetical protein [Nitrospiraceae bacterium]
ASTGTLAHICKCSIFRWDVVIDRILVGSYLIILKSQGRHSSQLATGFRIKRNLIVKLKAKHKYSVGKHYTMIKIVDVFGNDADKVMKGIIEGGLR